MSVRDRLFMMTYCALPLVFAFCAETTRVEETNETTEPTDVVGDVRFQTSCAEEV